MQLSYLLLATAAVFVGPALAQAEDIQAGDFIFIPTAGPPWAHLGRPLEPVATPYGHMGIIARGRNGWLVVHAEGSTMRDGGFVAWPLKRFVGTFEIVAIKRLKAPEQKRKALAQEALTSLSSRGFDTAFVWGGDKLYCTEFVYRMTWRATGLRLVDRLDHIAGRQALSISSVFNSSNLVNVWHGQASQLGRYDLQIRQK